MIVNSEDPDQMPRSAASDLGLYCLPMSQNGTLGLNGLRGLNSIVSAYEVSMKIRSFCGNICRNSDRFSAVLMSVIGFFCTPFSFSSNTFRFLFERPLSETKYCQVFMCLAAWFSRRQSCD